MSENWRQSEICIVINHKSQDSTPKHLSCDALLHYKFITLFAGERVFKIGEHLAKLHTKWLIVSYALDFCPQRCRTRRVICCRFSSESASEKSVNIWGNYGQEFSVL